MNDKVYVYKRKDARQNVAAFRAFIDTRDMFTTHDVCKALNMSAPCAHRYILVFHKQLHEIHVGAWQRAKGGKHHSALERVFYAGPGDDVPRPAPLTPKKRGEAKEKRLRMLANSVPPPKRIKPLELRRQKPKVTRDPMIAAFFG